MASPGGTAVVGSYAYTLDSDAIMRTSTSGSGATTVWAGTPGSSGSCTDAGTGANVTFNGGAVALTSDGTYLYSLSQCGIRRTDLVNGATTTLYPGYYNMQSLAVASNGGLYYLAGDGNNNTSLFQVNTGTGAVTQTGIVARGTYGGNNGLAGDTSGNLFALIGTTVYKYAISSGAVTVVGSDAELGSGLAYVGGYLYAGAGSPQADGTVRLRRYNPATFAGADAAGGAPGHQDGTGGNAAFGVISGVAGDGTNLWVADRTGYLREVAPGVPLPGPQQASVSSTPVITAGVVTTVAGSGAAAASAAGTGAGAKLAAPGGVAVVGSYAYTLDGDAIMRTTISGTGIGTTTVWAGLPGGTAGCTDTANGTSVMFNGGPVALITDGSFLYSESSYGSSGCGIRRTDLVTGATTTLGPRFGGMGGLAIASDGFLYFTAGNGSNSTALWRLNPANDQATQLVSTFGPSYAGSAGLTADTSFDLYAALGGAGATIYKYVISSGTLTSIATDTELGKANSLTYAGGYLYAGAGSQADGATRIRRYTVSSGAAADIAGGAPGHLDGTGGDASFGPVTAIATDGTNLWVADQTGYLRKVAPGTALPGGQQSPVGNAPSIGYGAVSTVAGSASATTSVAGTGSGARLAAPSGVAIVGSYAYTLDGDAIMRTAISGGGAGTTTVWAGTPGSSGTCTDAGQGTASTFNGGATGLVSDGTFLYSLSGGNQAGCGLRRTDLVTGATTTMGPQFPYAAGPTLGSDGNLYVTGGNGANGVALWRLNPTNDQLTQVVYAVGPQYANGNGITADTLGNLYLLVNATVYQYAISSGTLRTVGTVTTGGQGGTFRGFALFGTTLYVGESYYDASNTLVQALAGVSLTGGNDGLIAGGVPASGQPADGTGVAASFGGITGIASDGTSLWLTDSPGLLRKVVAVPPPPIPIAQTYGTTGLLDSGGAGSRAGCTCPTSADSSTMSGATGDPVNTVTGAQTFSATDAAVHAMGVPFSWTRSYTSADTSAGPMGTGWTFPYNATLTTGTGGAVTLRAEDGQQAVFTALNGGTYAAPPGIHSVLATVAAGGWTVTTRNRGVDTFNSAGQLISTVDRFGQGLTLGYAAGRLSGITDQAGRTVTVAWSGPVISGFTLADGRTVGYTYTAGQLTGVTDLRGHTWTYGYTGGLLSSVTDPNGHTVFNDTYTSGRVTSQLDGRGKNTTFGWNAGTQTATTTDPRGAVTTDVYTGNLLTKRTTPAGTTSYYYDQRDNIASVTNGRGYTTDYHYDPSGNMIEQDGPRGLSSMRTTYDGNNNITSRTDGRGNTTAYAYDANQRLSTTTDATHAVSTLTYAVGTEVATATDRRGKVTRYGYNPAGDLTTLTSPLGETTTYGYDSDGRRTTRVSPRGNVNGGTPSAYATAWAYDSSDNVTSVTDPRGHPTSTAYDPAGNVTSVTDATGAVTAMTYDADNRPLTVTGHPTPSTTSVTTDAYDDSGDLTSVTDPAGDTTTHGYDLAGRNTTTVRPLGNVSGAPAATTTAQTITSTYDADSDLVSVSQPNPAGGAALKTSYGYDALDRRTTVTDPLNHTTTTGYDADGDTVSTADPLGDTTTATYDVLDRPTASTDPRAKTTTYSYDPEGHRTGVTSPLGESTTTSYDDDGRPAGSVDARGNAAGATAATFTTTYGYDPDSDRMTVTDPLGRLTTSTYDADGNTASVTDADGHTTTYTYDPDNRTATVLNPDAPSGKTTSTAYDGLGNPLTRTDPLGHATTWTYDPARRPTSMALPNGNTWAYNYDANNNPTSTVTAIGTASGNTAAQTAAGTVTTAYDSLDRATSTSYGDGTHTVALGYDGASRQTTMTDGAGTEARSYDNADRLTKVVRTPTTGATQTYSYTYDPASNLATRTLPDSSQLTYTYDDDSRAASLAADGATTTYGYDPAGHLTTATLPAATHTVSTWAYDPDGRLTGVDNETSSSPLSRYTASLDPVGNPTAITSTRGTTSRTDAYTYDPANRLTSACYTTTTCTTTGTGSIAWAYDLVGNRSTETRAGDTRLPGSTPTADTTTYSYDTADQLTGAAVSGGLTSSTSYGYDRNGNQTTAGTTTSTYNLANQLTAVTASAQNTTYTYDGNNDRRTAASTVSGTTTNTVYGWDINDTVDQLAVEAATTGSTTTTRSYRYNPVTGLPASYTSTGTTGAQYDLQDNRQNTSDVITNTGTPQWAYDYEPFGTTRSTTKAGATAPANPLRYAGSYTDPTTGLDDLRARQYDPTTGRFTGRDPLARGASTAAFSTYQYAGDGPLTRWDPTGQDGWDDAWSLASGGASEVAGAVTGTITAVAHPIATFHALEGSCQAGLDRYANDTLAGIAQCIDNVDPASRVRDNLGTAVNDVYAGCTQQGLDALGHGLVGAGFLAVPEANEASTLGSLADAARTLRTSYHDLRATTDGESGSIGIPFSGAAEDAATMDSFTASGSTISHSPTATAIGDDADTLQNFARSRGAAGHDVIVHGDQAGNFRVGGNITHPQQIADAILENPDYGGGPINLVTCHGACGAAQELQEILGVHVNSSPFEVDLDPVSGLLREFP